MSDLKLLSALRQLPENITTPDQVQEYLKTQNRQNIKAIEDGFRRTHNNNTARQADNALRIADIADTNAAVAALAENDVLSSSCGAFTTSSGTFTAVTNLNTSITTLGRRVKMHLVGDGGQSSLIATFSGASGGGEIRIYNVTTSSVVAQYFFGMVVLGGAPSSQIFGTEKPASGTYNYRVDIRNISGTSVSINNTKLLLFTT